ncbi:YjcZ family sporulation protein [Neobacillus niacini]
MSSEYGIGLSLPLIIILFILLIIIGAVFWYDDCC